MDATDQDPVPVRRGRGRPKGAKNKPPPPRPPEQLLPLSTVPFEGYSADPGRVVADQLTMLSWQQDALRNEMKAAFSRGRFGDAEIVARLEKLSSGILKAIEALKKYDDLAEELQKRMTPEQLIEHAIKRIEGQDTATLNHIIKRLRRYRASIAPMHGLDKMQMGETGNKSAVELLAELDSE